MEGSLVAYKVFTNGSVLQASEVNENLMQQAVATFSNAAARTAAITSPVEGQLTYLLDVDRYDHWNGSSWVSPFGATLVNSTTFTTAGSVSLNNVFSSAYDNYKIVINALTSNNPQNLTLRMRSGGTDNTALEYRFGTMFVGAGTNQAFSTNNNTSSTEWILGTSQGATGMTTEVAVNRPFLSEMTSFRSVSAGSFLMVSGGQMTVTPSYDGFTLRVDSGNMTGKLRVYGLRN
jgi:hypothetical protein